MLEKAPNSSNLATQVLAQWKIEKCENFTYLRTPFLVTISPALIFSLCVLLLFFLGGGGSCFVTIIHRIGGR